MELEQLARYTIADLFCGCGGFSHGFMRSGRFNVVLGNDVKKEALKTFEFNHKGTLGNPIILSDDIREVSIGSIVEDLERKGVGEHELDCLIGGPPCQGFSQMRRSVQRRGSRIVKFKGYDRLAQDPRNDLVLRFLEIAEELRPKFIVIENVPQMLRHGYNGILGGLADAVREMLEGDMEYRVDVQILNAADYGVPQIRERVFFLACRDGHVALPEPTHTNPEQPNLLYPDAKHWVKVEDAIRDLPKPPLHKDTLGGGPIASYPNTPVSEYARRMRSDTHFPFNHVSRRYSPRIIKIIEEMQPGETWDHASARMQGQYEALIAQITQAGEDRDVARQVLIDEGQINPVFYQNYYWSAYTRLAWDQPALTITANANFLGSGRFTHPDESRGITMREAARIQSFDDDFKFITSANEAQYTSRVGVGMNMIGEAVPPLLAQAIAEHIAKLLDEWPI